MERLKPPLALLKSPAQEAKTGDVVCKSCGGYSAQGPDGTVYCCLQAELATLRALVYDLDRRLETELEDPPIDTHSAQVLIYLKSRVRRARAAR